MELGELFLKKQSLKETKTIHIMGDLWLVPCQKDCESNTYNPIIKPNELISQEEKIIKNRSIWTKEEDEILGNLVNENGTKAWSKIAKSINLIFYQGLDIRLPRNCRERWINYIDPNLKKGNWTPEEDSILFNKYKELGKKWSQISKFLIGRNENSVKNRWKSLARRRERMKNEEKILKNLTYDDNFFIESDKSDCLDSEIEELHFQQNLIQDHELHIDMKNLGKLLVDSKTSAISLKSKFDKGQKEFFDPNDF